MATSLVSEAEKLGAAAIGYSETLNGGVGPQYYDCSGLVQTALKDLGVTAPRTSEQQWAWAQSQNDTFTDQSKLVPGDLVFANFPGEVSPGHVGIYEGNGNVYSARSTSAGIGTDTLASWGSNIVGFATVPGVSASAPANTSSILGDLNPADWASALEKDLVINPVSKLWNWFLNSLGVKSLTDLLERGALIIFGAILLIMGLVSISSNSSGSPVKNIQESKAEGKSVTQKESDSSADSAASETSKISAGA